MITLILKYYLAMKKFSYLVIAAFFLCNAQAYAQKEVEEEIKNTLYEMWASIEKNDINKYAGYIHPDYTSFGENDVYRKEGKRIEIDGIRNWLSESSNVHTDMHQPLVTVKGDVAWITYYWTDHGDNNDGTTFSTRGKSTRIFVKENGEWLCIHGHFTSVE